MSTILVTGGNGFVAAQVLIAALERDYTVVSTVRTEKKGEETKTALSSRLSPAQLSKLSFAIVPVIEDEHAFDKVLTENKFDAVVHTATPFILSAKDPKEITGPAVGSTKSLFKAINDLAPTVKRVVLTSSFASVVDPAKGWRSGYVYSEKDWNPISWEETHDGDGSHAYYGAKKWAEKVAWEYMEENKPHFDLVALCPPMVFGQVAQYVPSAEALNTSSAALFQMLSPGANADGSIPPHSVALWVNVADLGTAHVLALSAKDASNKRFIIAADGTYNNKAICDVFRSHFPDLASRIPTKVPEGFNEDGTPIGGSYTADNSLSKEVLGLKYQSLEDTMVQFGESVKKFVQ